MQHLHAQYCLHPSLALAQAYDHLLHGGEEGPRGRAGADSARAAGDDARSDGKADPGGLLPRVAHGRLRGR